MKYLHSAQDSRGVRGYSPPENFKNLGLLECISCILEQLRIRNRNRTGNTNHRSNYSEFRQDSSVFHE